MARLGGAGPLRCHSARLGRYTSRVRDTRQSGGGPHRLNFCCRQALLPAACDLVVGSPSLPTLGKNGRRAQRQPRIA
jgi:hypothetical protein